MQPWSSSRECCARLQLLQQFKFRRGRRQEDPAGWTPPLVAVALGEINVSGFGGACLLASSDLERHPGLRGPTCARAGVGVDAKAREQPSGTEVWPESTSNSSTCQRDSSFCHHRQKEDRAGRTCQGDGKTGGRVILESSRLLHGLPNAMVQASVAQEHVPAGGCKGRRDQR